MESSKERNNIYHQKQHPRVSPHSVVSGCQKRYEQHFICTKKQARSASISECIGVPHCQKVHPTANAERWSACMPLVLQVEDPGYSSGVDQVPYDA